MPRIDRRIALAAVAAIACTLPACRRESRVFSGPTYTTSAAAGVRVDEDAAAAPMPAAGAVGPYDGNAWAMGEGQRLWNQMNCVGCHSHGGGGMGPALMDGPWRYGAEDGSIFTSIVDGRPNGMPAFRGRMSDDQVWQLVAYVKSLGGWRPKQAESARDDHMSVRPGTVRTDPQPITKEVVP